MKYRKKPVVIEAVLWDPNARPATYPQWLWHPMSLHPELFDAAEGTITIRTLEGEMTAQPGDYIIRGIKGELYPCKPDIFAATYEPVTEATS